MFAKYSNVPIFIATGDQGSAGGVGFPASCPNAIGEFLKFFFKLSLTEFTFMLKFKSLLNS